MKTLAFASVLLLTSISSQADENLDLFLTQSDGTSSRLVISSAALSTAAVSGHAQPQSSDIEREFETRWFTANKVHQYLGIGSLLAAVGAGIAPKEEGDSLHHNLGEAAAILGGLAVGTGVAFHYEDLSLKGGVKDPDNLHALLTTLGAIGFAIAVGDAPEGGHAGMGIAGAVVMLGGIKVNW